VNLSGLKDIQAALLRGDYSMTEIVQHYLQNIEKSKSHNIFIEVFADEALEQAKSLDERIKIQSSDLGSLFGAVISIKDNICYKGHRVSAGSRMLENYESPYTATVVDRLIKSDAIIIGRTNCDEFSMGSTNESSYYGPTLNANDKSKIPGGSTGGGAVSVKLNTCLAALGSDTGGSIRQPAAFNGVVGYKPSYGFVSRWGLIAYGSSFDQIGTITESVDDIIPLISTIAGPDEYDSTLVPHPPIINKLDDLDLSKAKVAYISNMASHPKLSEAVTNSFRQTIEKLKAEGSEVEAVDFNLTDLLVPAYYILTAAEASSNLSRFDGVRYGYRSDKVFEDYRDMMQTNRTEGFGFEVKKRIMLGTYVLSEGYYDAYFKKAQQVRTMITNQINTILDKYDFILMPTTTDVAWSLGESVKDPVEMYLSDIFTVLANITGMPAVTLPADRNGVELPLGIQLLGKHSSDRTLLAFAKKITTLA